MISNSVIKEKVKSAWIEGFFAAGEGWNGEYPFGQTTGHRWLDYMRGLEEQFDKWWRLNHGSYESD